MRVCVVTVSDRAFAGVYADESGPEIESIIGAGSIGVEISRELVSDDLDAIVACLERNADADFIITTGGTGLSVRDVTPEATRRFCDRGLPGIEEALRAESMKETPRAMLSRGAAGVRGKTIVVNFPGSVRAVRLCTRVLLPVMEHAAGMLRGEGH